MTDSYFFDSDCISAFLWVGEQNLLTTLYPNRIIIPQSVYDELSHPSIPHLKSRIDALLSSNQAKLESIILDTPTYDLYRKLTVNPDPNHLVIGKGEAAAIAMAKTENGIIASNNLRDIQSYVDELNISHITTGDILVEALEKELITEEQGNTIWASMLARKRKLGALSFSDYLKVQKVKS